MIVSDTSWLPNLSDAGRSKYKALAQAIRDDVKSGALPQGDKLPTVRDLAYRIGVTPGTVARAYKLLTDDEILMAEVGRGTFVARSGEKQADTIVPLIHLVDETTADFRSSRVPDVGQGRVIDDAFIRLGQSHRRRYINYPTEATDIETRQAVVDWLAPRQLGDFGPDDIVLGNGAQHCCILALQNILTGPHPVILTEELAYPGARHAARLLRAKVVGVAMDDDGIIPAALSAAYRAYGGQVLLTAADVHSPTTVKTGLVRKQQLAAVAKQFGLAIIEDDCHTISNTDVPAYRALLPDQSYLVSSLTKSVSGALRFGFIVAPNGHGKTLRQVGQSSFYGVAQPILDVCADLIRSGDAAKIRAQVERQTAHRVRLAAGILGKWGLRSREDAPFAWLPLPTGWRASSFTIACERRGVTIRPADEFVLSNARAPNAVRLAVNTCVSEALFVQALHDMADLLKNPVALIDG